MRKHPRLDDNQRSIVVALRLAGCSVQSLASVGAGCGDVLVGRAGINYLLEIKDGSKPPSERKLTFMERLFHSTWKGKISVVNSVPEALKAVGL